MPNSRSAPTILILLALMATPPSTAESIRLRPMPAIYLDSLGASLKQPEAVGVSGETLLVVADSGNRRLLLFDVTEESTSPQREIRVPQVSHPIRVRIDSSGDILALDGRTSSIARVGSDGSFKGLVEIPVTDRQQQVLVRSFDLDSDDNLYVLSTSDGLILVLGPDGSQKRAISVPPEAGFLSDLTVSSTGVVFAIDSVNKQVFVGWKDAESMEPLTDPMPEDMAFPTAIAADSFGNLFVADKTGGGIVIVGQNGSFKGRQSSRGWKVGFLRHPTGLAVGGDYLFVADRSNNRVQRFEILQ